MSLAKITSCIFYFTLLITQGKSDCKTPIKELKNILALDPINSIQSPHPHDRDGNIVRKTGESITLACPGGAIKGSSSSSETMQFTCLPNPRGGPDTYGYKITTSTCKEPLQTKEKLVGYCNGQNFHIRIGFEYKNTAFDPQIELCWDDVNKRTLWTYAVVRQQVRECATLSDRSSSSWKSGDYFKKNLENMYAIKKQRTTLEKILHPNRVPPTIFNKNKHLQKGHLVANCDFMYSAQQRLTFHYINAAPQWNTFNTGNWKVLENKVRAHAKTVKSNLQVYTGTYDILQINGHQFHLNVEANVLRTMPVPKYFWKVIKNGNVGVAVIGSNDIFSTTPPRLCNDILHKISWLKNFENAKVLEKGYMIACSVADFINISPKLKNELPDFSKIVGVFS